MAYGRRGSEYSDVDHPAIQAMLSNRCTNSDD